jgi:two-component system, NtrC family, sensor kinase
MRTVIIGGGRACREIIELAAGPFLRELRLNIRCVMDTDPNAPGMVFAQDLVINTTSDLTEALNTSNLELIIELTGRDDVLEQIQKNRPPGVKLVDHTFARIFWDLVNAQTDQIRRIEEMAQLEKKIDEERHFLQELVDNIPELLVVLDNQKKAVRINASFSQFVEIPPENAVGKTCPELFKNTDFKPHCDRESNLLDEILKYPQTYSSVWITPAPNETHWEVTRKPLLNSEGNSDGILVTWHKITEQVMLRREMESASERMKSFIDSAHDCISMKDLEGKYILVNPATTQAFGKTPEDFIGNTAKDVLPTKLAKIIRQHDHEVINGNCHKTYEETVSINGKDHYFQTVRFPLSDYAGRVIGVCTLMRDMTEERDLRAQLIQSSKLVAIGQLAAGVAHEINNPLTGILAYAEDMQEDLPADDEHQDDVKVIIRETKRCRDIVRNLLDFARQEAPKLEKTDPNMIVEQSLLLVQKLPQFRNITIHKNIAESIPSIQCDPQQIQQVILNLMLNATDAMTGKGSITLTSEYNRKQDKCIISVADDGPGIPENLVDKIFEPFFSTKGTNGLGLAVSWGIIERHHGTIEVDMSDEGGAVFLIVLPAYNE